MAFLFQSMRSFKVRITLIFFTFVSLVIVLLVGFFQIQKKLDYLHVAVDDLQKIKYSISNTSFNTKTDLIVEHQGNNQLEDQNTLESLSIDFQDSKSKLLKIKRKLFSHSIDFEEKFVPIAKDIDLLQQATVSGGFGNDFFKATLTHLDKSFESLTQGLNQLNNSKSKSLYNNILILLILIAVLITGFVYFLAQRMTNDFMRLNLKMSKTDNFDEKPIVSKIDDVKKLDKSFELLKSKIRRLELDLDEANKSSEYKSVFLANMSYEIRTPLNSVLGMINMLKQSELTTDQQVQLEIAEYSSEHVLQLVNMILDNSKVEGGKIELELTAIDLKSDLSKLVKVFEYEAWEKSLEFEFKFLADEKQKFLLLGDIKRIKQILTNLLSNAIKFTNAGKVSLTIDQTVGPDDFQIVTFYVKDTGIGIPPDKAKRIFNESKKNHQSLMDYYGGTGLGLTASCQLIDLMGGELKLESKENEGSIFYFSIQLKKTLNLEREKVEPTPVLLNKFDYRFTVLVAEDNKMNQKVIKFLLEQQGADCTFAKNGSDAVKLFNILDFDMVFMDIFMPEMDGYEATKLIKSSEKYKANKVPIIAVSASAFDEDIENAKKAGIDDFLAKPIDTDKLGALLVKYSPKGISAN